jgi:hypothetical protein
MASRSFSLGHLDRERERSLRHGIARVENLRQDRVTEIDLRRIDHGLFGRDEQTHELRRPGRFVRWFSVTTWTGSGGSPC